MATRHPRRPGSDLAEQARRAGVRLVRFLYTDNGGITRGKATHVDGLAHRLTDGIGLPELFWLAARWGRRGLGTVLDELIASARSTMAKRLRSDGGCSGATPPGSTGYPGRR